MRELQTSSAGMTNLHHTRETDRPVRIDPPENGPGPKPASGEDGEE
jgi:hypothetical protein